MKIGRCLTDEGQIEEVEKPLRNSLAKDRPTVVLFVTVSGVNSRGLIRRSYHVQVKEASTIRVVVQTNGPHELYCIQQRP